MITINYDKRKDCRTEEKFKQDIEIGHENESSTMNLFFWSFWKKRSPDSKLLNTGCDNSGKIIKGRVKDTPDFTIIANHGATVIPIGVSASWHPDFATIKQYNLFERAKNPLEYMLMAFNVGYGKKVSMVFGKTAKFVNVLTPCASYLYNFEGSGKPAWRFYNFELAQISSPVFENEEVKISFLD